MSSTRHNSLLKVDHGIVLQEKYEKLHVLNIVHVTIKTFRVLRLRQGCFKTLAGIWFCLRNAGEFTGYMTIFHLGVNSPTTLNESLRNWVLRVWICSLYSPPLVKCLFFKNIQNVLIFRVLHMIFYCPFC